jgi:hypothetical protein
MLLLGCAHPAADRPGVDDTAEPDDSTFAATADENVALPFVTVGDAAPEATLALVASGTRGSRGDVHLTVTGDFAVDGDTGPLVVGEIRHLAVRYTGDLASPHIDTGSVAITVDESDIVTTLAAVVGDPDLPDATWIADGWGKETTLALPSAPFPDGSAPYDDSSVLLFYPTGLSDRGDLGIVTHLHGFGATLSDIVVSQRLVEQHALSGRDALLIVPQGPVDAEDGDWGRLDEPDGFADLVRDAVSVLYRDGVITRPVIGPVAITSHSGGYQGAANIVEQGGIPITAVHLFDSLYGRADTFAAFAEAGGVLRSCYTATGGTDVDNEDLAATLEDDGVDVGVAFTDDVLLAGPVTIGPVDSAHAASVRDDRNFARWLAASGLPRRPNAPPELLSVLSDGARTTVSWRRDGSGAALRYRVEGAADGHTWTLLTDTDTTSATVSPSPYVRVVTTDVRFGNSDPSDIYGGTGADWLVVDGFDRVLDGSWDAATHPFAADVGNALDGTFSVASNEAVASGAVSLGDYAQVVWLLGDEGLADRTFDPAERAAVEAYVAGGGALIVSGSEVGYATDPTWLDDVLHTRLVADDAETTGVEGWTVGAQYPEDYPDVLDGDAIVWTWDTGGAAAVGWNRQVIVVGFGVENLDDADRRAALQSLEDWLR